LAIDGADRRRYLLGTTVTLPRQIAASLVATT
jgi:hypothetical protein